MYDADNSKLICLFLVFLFFLLFSENINICPECGSDHVVQLASQSTPYSSTPIHRSPRPDSGDEHLDITQSTQGANKVGRSEQ